MNRGAALVLLVAVPAMVLSGCTLGEDDEMVAPTRTITGSPSPEPRAVPAAVPVGKGSVGPTDVVWAQGNALHVGTRTVDLSPVSIDAFVVAPGGVYLLDGKNVSFTDLERVRATGLTGVTALGATADASRLEVVTEDGGPPASSVYDTRTGNLSDEEVSVASAQARLGRPVGVDVTGERVDLVPPDSGELRGWQGPGRYGVAVTRAGEPVAFDSRTRTRVDLGENLPQQFELAGWTDESTFYGVDFSRHGPAAVVACGLADGWSCTRQGEVSRSEPVIFGSGT